MFMLNDKYRARGSICFHSVDDSFVTALLLLGRQSTLCTYSSSVMLLKRTKKRTGLILAWL